MAKSTTRRLVIDGEVYLWRVTHRHRPCAELFTAYLQDHSRAPIRASFAAGAERGQEYIERHGVVTEYKDGGGWWNLNSPRIARALIERARRHGWLPESAKRPLELDGWQLIEGVPCESG
jgi:hypothetical protein